MHHVPTSERGGGGVIEKKIQTEGETEKEEIKK
jgi:hypothetical protein